MHCHALVGLVVLLLPALRAQGVATSRLPIKEVTVFKDGHAFVLRSGEAPVDERGEIVLDELPQPVLGTFWPAATGPGLRVTAATSGKRRVVREQTAMRLRELLEANIGAQVMVHEIGDARYPGTVVGLPARSSAELAAAAPGGEPPLPERGSVVLIKTAAVDKMSSDGVRAVALDRILDLTFVETPKSTFREESLQNRLTLKLDWGGNPRPATAQVALAWLAKGLRWIPSYRVSIDGAGNATVRLQASLVNELADLDNVTMNLVIGVPSFVAKDQLDPIALAAAVAARAPDAQFSQTLSNAFMTQVSSNLPAPTAPPAPADLGPEVAGGRKEEDLYVFTVKGISLRLHDRMVVPLAEFTVKYRDVWKLDVPVTPPREAWEHMRGQGGDLARLMAAPRVQHEIRLDNPGPAPLTTGPALVLSGDKVLAQGLIMYTPAGASCDVPVTTAVDILVRKSEKESGRTPNAIALNSNHYLRVDLQGSIKLENRRRTTVEIEVTRAVLGNVTSASTGGTTEQANPLEDSSVLPAATPAWIWSWWPGWWHQLNGVGRARWTVKLAPAQSTELTYAWNYFWR